MSRRLRTGIGDGANFLVADVVNTDPPIIAGPAHDLRRGPSAIFARSLGIGYHGERANDRIAHESPRAGCTITRGSPGSRDSIQPTTLAPGEAESAAGASPSGTTSVKPMPIFKTR